MRAMDYGYDLTTGYHNKLLTRAESVFAGILWAEHTNPECKAPAGYLASRFAFGVAGVKWIRCGRAEKEQWKREVRKMQNHLLHKHDNIPVLSKSGHGGGYWIAATEAEAAEFYHTFRQRGITGLVKATDGHKAALVEAVEQLVFEFEDISGVTALETTDRGAKNKGAAPEIVDSLLAKMTGEPEKFASSLRKIREKYFSGGVLLEKNSVIAMQQKTRELQKMVEALGA